MRLIRGRDDARWLPSRHHFAIFRLAAWLKLRRTAPAPGSAILIIDRHQSAAEAYATTIWITATSTCFAAEALFSDLPLLLALFAGLVTSTIIFQLLIIAGGTIFGPLLNAVTHSTVRENTRLTSILAMLIMTAVAIHLATSGSWVRFAAWQFLALLVMNGVAATILFALRSRIEQREAEVGGETFVL
jgi:hypothetical protein